MISQQDLQKWQTLGQWLDKQSGKFATVLMLGQQFPDCNDLYQIYSPIRANNLPNNYDLVLGQIKRSLPQPRAGDMVLSPKHQASVLLGGRGDS